MVVTSSERQPAALEAKVQSAAVIGALAAAPFPAVAQKPPLKINIEKDKGITSATDWEPFSPGL